MVSLIGMILIYRLMMFIMDRIITKPISILQNAVEDFRLNKDSKRVHDQISLMKTNNEIHTLGNNFDDFSSAIERYIDDIHAAEDEIEKLSDEILQSLAQTIDAKDVYTKGHSIRVAKYSKMLATRLKLPEKTIENIYKQGLLHDIGKIGIPDGIINKPGKLTDEEFAIIKSHTTMGSDILSKAESFPELARAARWHHERYDGLGYPDGLSAEDIPLEVRIISVADSYDAMSSNRSYRNYLAQEVVKKEIQKGMGTQFDPEIAKIMLEIIDEDPDYELREQ
jgi:putative nucleotidyltransferase with HDIG domain